VESTRVSQSGAAGSTVYFCRRLVLLASSKQGPQHALDRFSAACDRARMKISTKNTEVLCISTNARQCMRQVNVNTLQQVDTFKSLGVVFSSDGRRSAMRLIHGLVKLTQFCVSFIALWPQNGSFQTPQRCQFSNRSLFRSLPMVMNLG